MKHVFLLDENVLIKPIMAQDAASMELWATILRNCHSIALSPELAERLWEWLREKRRELSRNPNPMFHRTVVSCLTRSDKTKWVDAEPIQEEVYIRDTEDKFLVRIAAKLPGCIFVSTDRDTRDDFNRDELANKYDTKGVTIEEAVVLAREV